MAVSVYRSSVHSHSSAIVALLEGLVTLDATLSDENRFKREQSLNVHLFFEICHCSTHRRWQSQAKLYAWNRDAAVEPLARGKNEA